LLCLYLTVWPVRAQAEVDRRAEKVQGVKVAADKFPFRFMAMKPRSLKAGGGWEVEEF